jgi:hypothetical protein
MELTMADKDLGTSLTDFLKDLVGADSNVSMAGNAAVEGFDPKKKEVVNQIIAAIQKSKDDGPGDIVDAGNNASLADASRLAIHQKNHLSLLSNLQDFYSKKYGIGTGGTAK